VKTACRQEYGVARVNANLMNVIGHCSIPQCVFEFLAGDSFTKSDKNFSPRISVCDIPELSFWLAAQATGNIFRRMHL
jgi:hypothetical protein